METDGKIIIGTEVDNSEFDKKILEAQKKIESANKRIEEAQKGINKAKEETIKYEQEIQQIEEENQRLQNAEQLNNEIKKVGFSIKNITKEIVKWGLAIFGIRGIFGFIRNSMNIIAQQDEQLANDIQYMKNALAYSLEPIIRIIVNLAKQLLQLIGGIIYLMTGKNVFENANKSLAGANKQASKLKKQLAGFDEMNILSDSSTEGGGTIAPSIDLTNVDEMIKKVEELKDKWYDFGEEMRQSLYDMPFENWTNAFGNWDLALYGITQTIHGLWGQITNMLKSVKNLWDILYGIFTGDTDKIKKGFEDLIKNLWEWIKSTYETIKGIDNSIKGIIGGLISTIWGWLFDFINKGINKFNEFKDKVVNVWTEIRDKIKNKITEIQNWLTAKFGVIGAKIGEVIGSSFKAVINSVLSSIESLLNFPIKSINALIGTINKIPGINLKTLSTFKFPRLAKGGIVNNPGPGVMMGSYIAGEKGPEAVIPLDDLTLDRLGEAFARHTQINASIPVYVGNRQIARELKRIDAENNFAYNS